MPVLNSCVPHAWKTKPHAESSAENPGRDPVFDILKAIGICWVVFGHTYVFPFYQAGRYFAVPLFYFVAGYFYKDKYTRAPHKYLLRRAATLYLPFQLYGVVFLLLHNVFCRLHLYDPSEPFRGHSVTPYTASEFAGRFLRLLSFATTEQLLGPLWFIPALFYSLMLFCLVRFFWTYLPERANTLRFARGKGEAFAWASILLLALSGLSIQGAGYNPPRNADRILIALLFVALGFVSRRRPVILKFSVLSTSGALAFLVAAVLYPDPFWRSGAGPFLRLPAALAGIHLCLFAAFHCPRILQGPLALLGRHTYAVLALHLLSFKAVNFIQVKLFDLPAKKLAAFPVLDSGGLWFLAYAACGIIMPVLPGALLEFIRSKKRLHVTE